MSGVFLIFRFNPFILFLAVQLLRKELFSIGLSFIKASNTDIKGLKKYIWHWMRE